MSSLVVIIMGFSSSLLQIISLRQLLTVFSGNELDIGITLAVWLTTVGIGSYTGYRLRTAGALAVSFILVGLLAQLTVLSASLIRPALSLEFGETVPLGSTFFSTVLTLAPLCFLLGVQFPLAVSYMGSTSKTYSLEAAGAFIGGLAFTLAFSGRLDSYALATAVSVINIGAAFYLAGRKSLLALLLVPLLLYSGMLQADRLQLKAFTQIEKTESRYGEIAVLRMQDQTYVYASGKFQFSYPDPQAEELHAHIPATAHHLPRRMLVIGGSPGLLREYLKHPADRIDFVEIDPEMIAVTMRLLNPDDRVTLRDRRLSFIIEDARKFVKSSAPASYDLIVLHLPEPSSANINRFYTLEFFREAKQIMHKDGILALSLPTASGYIGRKMQVANGSIYASARAVFSSVAVSSEEYGYIFASGSPLDVSPVTLARRFADRAIQTRSFYPGIFSDAFSPLKVRTVQDRLSSISSVNSDARPVSYLYSLMLWADMHGASLLGHLLGLRGSEASSVFLVLLMIIMAIGWRWKKAVSVSLFTTGYSAMAFSMVIILSYQASFGYVYEMIGLLTSFFMIGMASGALTAQWMQRPMRWLQSLEGAWIVLFLLPPLLFTHEVSFYILNTFCGILTGMQFSAANIFIMGRDTARTAGRLYAMELSGSFAGALLTSLLLMPLFGMKNALAGLAVLKAASLLLLTTGRHEKS